jgi:hemolysin III
MQNQVETRYKLIYSKREEFLNTCSHACGLILSILGLCLIVIKSATTGNETNVIACSIYGVSLVLMYGASSFYHGCKSKTLKAKLRVVDHLNIYLLIAGTYTPISLIALHGKIGWTIFGIMWTLTVLGVLYKTLFFTSSWVSSFLYILMGWVAMIFIVQIIHAIPTTCFMFILLGGVFYTSGVVFYMLDEVQEFMHFVWHIFVLLGSIFHFLAIYVYIATISIN